MIDCTLLFPDDAAFPPWPRSSWRRADHRHVSGTPQAHLMLGDGVVHSLTGVALGWLVGTFVCIPDELVGRQARWSSPTAGCDHD